MVQASNDSFFFPNENANSFIYYDLTFTFRFKSHSIKTQNDAKPILNSAPRESSIQLVGVNPKPVVILPWTSVIVLFEKSVVRQTIFQTFVCTPLVCHANRIPWWNHKKIAGFHIRIKCLVSVFWSEVVDKCIFNNNLAFCSNKCNDWMFWFFRTYFFQCQIN